MKNIFKTMLPILAMAACVWASCSDDKDDPTPGKPALPTIAVSEPALSADNAKAVVTVTQLLPVRKKLSWKFPLIWM